MKKVIGFCCLLLLIHACKTKKVVPVVDDGIIEFTFVQLNDVYEIAPLNAGKYGGLARVAHVYDSIKALQPNTYLFMAGDFLNPSLLGNLKYNGERIRGKQMIEVMNAMHFELVTFGNHEFDLKEFELQDRMNASNFYWTSANCFQQLDDGPRSFYFERGGDTIYVPETYTIQLKDNDGTEAEVGLFGVTLPSNPKDYVYYSDIYLEAGSAYTSLQQQAVDVIVGLTHLAIDQDKALAEKFPEVSLIMGGHEHDATYIKTDNTRIAKADANAKTIYVHNFKLNIKTEELEINSTLLPIDDKVKEKPEVKNIVDKWQNILNQELNKVIINPDEVIYLTKESLNGLDSASRGEQTNLGKIIATSMAFSFNEPAQAAIVNGGSMRLDDKLNGSITSLDIFRVLPFGGNVQKVEITGELLIKVLEYGNSRRGSGAYLQRYNLTQNDEGAWLLEGDLIEKESIFTIALSDFLLTGYDIPFLTPENKGIVSVYKPLESEAAWDIRKAVIQYLKNIKK